MYNLLHLFILLILCFQQVSFTKNTPMIVGPVKTPHKIIPWKNSSIKLSTPPPLMGKQMGTVETLGIPPLGYELDGTTKIFKLILQPVEKIITNTNKKPSWYHLIPEKNSGTHAS